VVELEREPAAERQTQKVRSFQTDDLDERGEAVGVVTLPE
jgi:hypothetical protein